MALAEALADKHPRISPRVAGLPWLGRIAAGAVAGAVLAPHLARNAKAGALLGAAAAGTATKLTFDARAKLGARIGSARAGLVEDAITYGLCLPVVTTVRRSRRRHAPD